MSSNKNTKIAETAVMVALSAALALVSDVIPFLQLPLGGHVTLFSALPIIYIAVRYGCGQGFLAGFCVGVIQLLSGMMKNAAALMMEHWYETVLMLFLDYILAYTVYGAAGVFAKKSPSVGLTVGSVFALFLRYICHIVSGAIFFGQWAEWFFGDAEQLGGTAFGSFFLEHFSGAGLSAAYSVVYNGLYMIPEIIITAVAGFCLSRTAFVRKQLGQ